MTNNTTETATKAGETTKHDYIAKQYRVVRIEDGWKTRKERIGVAWKAENGSICFRTSGSQVIQGDVYFYPLEIQGEE